VFPSYHGLAIESKSYLEIERAEELGEDKGIEAVPFESQHSIEAYERMENKMATAQNLLTLPHSHLYPNFFPKDFKGKIIFIKRDPRAVAASAYPFLQKVLR